MEEVTQSMGEAFGEDLVGKPRERSLEVRFCFLLWLLCFLLPQNGTTVLLECGKEPVGLRERRN